MVNEGGLLARRALARCGGHPYRRIRLPPLLLGAPAFMAPHTSGRASARYGRRPVTEVEEVSKGATFERAAIGRAARWLAAACRPYLGRGFLFVVGVGVIGLGFAQLNGGDPLSLSALGIGGAMVFAACILPWIDTLRAGGAAGLDLHLRPPKEDAAKTTALTRRKLGSPTPTVPADEAAQGARVVLAEMALATIFRNEILADCRFHLYLPDQVGLLGPVLEHAGRDPALPPPESWPIGHGVVGKAWSEEAFIRAVGAASHDETHGLSPEQQARYANTQVVAALPVRNSQAVIGVVSAASLRADSKLADEDGYEELVLISQLVGRVLIDVLKWFPD